MLGYLVVSVVSALAGAYGWARLNGKKRKRMLARKKQEQDSEE